jgi:uncharacterized protein
MTIREEITAKRSQILEIAARYGAYNVRIFGSVARDDAGPESDIDFLINLEPGRSLLDHIALKQDLEDLFHRKVDVANEKGLHWFIHDQVLSESVPV